MKIGYLSDIYPKTSETFVSNEIAGLSQYHDVRVFAMESEGEAPCEGEVIYFKKRMVKDGLSSLKAGLGSELLSRSAFEHYFRMAAEYFSEFAKDEEILHRHFATNSIVYYLATKLDVPYTVTTHAWDIFADNRYAHVKEVLKNAAKVITISEYNKKYMINKFGLKEEDIEVVRMGIDPDRFQPKGDQGDQNKILSVGRLIEKKGFEYAIRAVHILSSKYPDIEYTIVGSGPEKKKLLALIDELKLHKRVEILENVTDFELVEEYNRAGMFVLPCIQASDGDLDGIPVVLMEAMAMEIPVVSTSVSGIPELIEHGKSGLLVEPKNPKVLALKLEDILSGRVDFRSMASEGRKTVIKRFNLKDQVSSVGRIFEDIISGDS